MKTRGLVLAAGALMGLGSAAMAQSHAFPVFNPAPSNVNNTWLNTNLGAAPAGNYTSYIVAFDWFSVGAGNGWSNEARSTLSSLPANASTLTTPTYPVGNTLYRNNLVAPTGSIGTTANRPNVYWTGVLTTPYGGGSDMYLNFRQSFADANMNWENVRVVLNPTINSITNNVYQAAPGTFTDLGTLSVGNTNLSVPVAAGGGQWYRFGVDTSVNNAAGNAFDVFGGGTQDTRLHIFRESSGTLVPIASTDDIAGSTNRNGGASFGSSDPAGFGRDTWTAGVPGGATWFNGRGGSSTVTGIPSLTNTAGAGALDAGETYWAWVGFWSGSALTAPVVSSTFVQVGPTSFDIETTRNIGFTSTTLTTADYTLNFLSVPAPGALALLGMGGLLAARRRR